MMMSLSRPRSFGFTLAETMITMLIMVYIAFAVFQGLRFVSKTNIKGADRAFATQKAIQIMEELRALTENPKTNGSIKTLDDYDNSPIYQDPNNILRYILTTKPELND